LAHARLGRRRAGDIAATAFTLRAQQLPAPADAVNFRAGLVQTMHELVNDLKPPCAWQAQGRGMKIGDAMG
jgi:hypothetical protein